MNCNLVYEYDQVDWLDTDASEDEDYLPQFPRQEKEEFPIVPSIEKYNQQKYCIEHTSSISSISSISEDDVDDFSDRKRGRMNSMSWDTNDTRRKKKSNETPLSKVRKAIDNVVDNGIEQVDISNIELEDIPDEIGELAYVTVLHNDIVKSASLQLFLYNNRIHTLSPVLFRLKNLTVLSLRNNCLETIPPDIALLENLIELSLGNNHLKYIPAELLRLKKLTTLSLFPNPYLQSQQKQVNFTSLKEICTRIILNQSSHTSSLDGLIPEDILLSFQTISVAHYCENCKLLFHSPCVEEVIWQPVLGNPNIPVMYRFCSTHCSQSIHQITSQVAFHHIT